MYVQRGPYPKASGSMSELPARARCVVIGAGIVGNSLAYHLARLGWRDIVLLDKGPLPNPGGSTGHASNFIFPVDHSREMTDLTLDSVRQYKELGVFTESGGIEVARTEARMQELRRRIASSKAWGIESELVDPAALGEDAELLILLDAVRGQRRHLARVVDREDEVRGLAGGPAGVGQRTLVQEHDVAPAEAGQVVDEAVADDAGADDDDARSTRLRAQTNLLGRARAGRRDGRQRQCGRSF